MLLGQFREGEGGGALARSNRSRRAQSGINPRISGAAGGIGGGGNISRRIKAGALLAESESGGAGAVNPRREICRAARCRDKAGALLALAGNGAPLSQLWVFIVGPLVGALLAALIHKGIMKVK